MSRIVASITTSIDGYITGPDDGPERGLGIGGERLHHWVFGGPWTYDAPGRGEPVGADKEWLDSAMASNGAVIAGRSTYEAAGHWGDANPFGVPFFIVTHRVDDQPAGDDFVFVGSLDDAVARATAAAGDGNVHIMGGADVLRQAFARRHIESFTLIVAPVVLGGGKRLFEGFTDSFDLVHAGVRQSPFATFIDYQLER